MNSKEGLAEAFNGVSLKLIKQFISNVEAGSVQIDDVGDLSRLFNIYRDVNELGTGEEGTGSLPKMSQMQRDVLGSDVKLTGGDSEDDVSYVDLEDMMNLDADDIEKMMNKREVQINKENEATL